MRYVASSHTCPRCRCCIHSYVFTSSYVHTCVWRHSPAAFNLKLRFSLFMCKYLCICVCVCFANAFVRLTFFMTALLPLPALLLLLLCVDVFIASHFLWLKVVCWRCCPVSASPFHTQFVYIARYICGDMPVSLLQFDKHCEVELSSDASRRCQTQLHCVLYCCCFIIWYAHHFAILHSCCCWRDFNTFLFYVVDSLIYYTHTCKTH